MTAWLALAGVWAVVSFGYRALGLVALGRHARAARTAPASAAPGRVVLLRPLCGAPAYLDRCLASLARAAERGDAEVHLAIEDPADPAHGHLARVPDARVRTGAAVSGANRKIANLLQLEAEETAELLVISDADIDVPEDYVARCAAAFDDPEVGLATAPYRSVAAPSASSRLDALLTNLHFLPNTCFAVAAEGLHFGLGSTLAVRRKALAEIGGLGAVVDESGDDLALARRIAERGWRLAWLPLLVDHVLADVGLRGALARHVRCYRITRDDRPAGFLALMFLCHGWLAALAVSATGGVVWPSALWWGGSMLLQWSVRDALGIRARDLLLGPLVDALSLAVQGTAWWGRPTPPPAPVRPGALP